MKRYPSCVALNTTTDVSSHAIRIRPTVKVRTQNVQQRPGGGGVNVAAVIATLGGSAELVVLAGGATGAILKALAATAIRTHSVEISGSTRIAFMVHEEETGLEYRFVPEGPEIVARDVCAVLQVVDEFQGSCERQSSAQRACRRLRQNCQTCRQKGDQGHP